MNQSEFLSQLEDLVEYGRAKDSCLEKEEVDDYCKDMNLTKEQMQLVYQYLMEHHIDVGGKKAEKDEKMNETDSTYLRIYRKEILSIPSKSVEEMERIYASLLDGNEEVVQTAIESNLKKVMDLAVRYKNRGVLLEDLIQEGNLKLIITIQGMCGQSDVLEPHKDIERALRERMIELVDEQLAASDLESGILAKTNLIHEATRVLAEDLARVANIHELAEYTRMTEEEIMDIADLAADKIEIGVCEHHHHEDE